MKLRLRRLLVFGLAILVVGTVVYAFMPQPVPVDIAAVTRGPMRVTVDEDGKTRIKERYIVSSPLAGRLQRISLNVGDLVDAGKTRIALVEPTNPTLLDSRARAEAEARVKTAQAKVDQTGPALEQSKAALQFAESELGRVQDLRRRNSATEREFEEKTLLFRLRTEEYRVAKFNEEISHFELEQAESALLRTKSDPDQNDPDWNFEIFSPISGKVLRLFQESSTVVTPGTQILELGDPRDLEVEIDVLSNDAVRVQPGNKVSLEHWGGERPLEGVVRLIEPAAFTKTSALGVEEQRVYVIVDLNEPPEQRTTLGDAFRVEARISVWESDDVLRVPVSALFRVGEDWAVFVAHNGRAVTRKVKVDHRNETEAEVLEGLEPGEQVVVHPSDQVSDGVGVIPR